MEDGRGGGGGGGEWGKRDWCSKHCDEDCHKVIFSKPEDDSSLEGSHPRF